jgi:hypothetical protein
MVIFRKMQDFPSGIIYVSRIALKLLVGLKVIEIAAARKKRVKSEHRPSPDQA